MSTEQQEDSTDKNTILSIIKQIVQSDANLCNFVRYMDYGYISKNNEKRYWSTKQSILNENQLVNNNQIVRFVNALDTKFLCDCEKVCETEGRHNGDSSSKVLDIIYNNVDGRRSSYYRTINEMQNRLTDLMINIDCSYKITGTSLTAFDFLMKNPEITEYECSFYTKVLYNNLTKLIFVGDKCYLLALMDKRHRVYVSLKILTNIYKKDTTQNKEVFTSIVTKLFCVISKCCIYLLNTNMSQYFNNIICSPIIADIFKNVNLNIDEKISLNSLRSFTFSDNKDTDDFIKVNILETIKKHVENYINSKYYIDNIDYGEMIRRVRENITNANLHLVNKAYVSGIKLYKIFSKCGWHTVDDVDEENRNVQLTHLTLNPNNVYIYKDLDFIPTVAYVYPETIKNCQNRRNCLRKIKSDNVQNFYRGTGFKIHRLYLDIINGVLYCDGKHPNISTGNVCMGDLKGKVVLSTATENDVIDLLQKCEDLLKCMNYTSSYTQNGCNYFSRDDYSEPYAGIDVDTQVTVTQSKDEIVDFSDTNNDDLEDIDEEQEETSQQSEEFQSVTEFESDDYDEVEDENEGV